MAAVKGDFTFLRLWPRQIFKLFEGKKLAAKQLPSLKKPGVYVLYRGDEPYYIGKATRRLFSRLHDHANKMTDPYYAFWDHFSCFAFADHSRNKRKKIGDIEAVLIAAMPRAMNSSKRRWPKGGVLPKHIRAMMGSKSKAMAVGAGS